MNDRGFASDARLSRQVNLGRALALIRTRPFISQTEMAQELGLSKATVTDIVGALKRDGLLESVGRGEASPAGGRRPRLLRFNPGAAAIIGVELDMSGTKLALLDLGLNVLQRQSIPAPPKRDADAVLARLISGIRNCIDAHPPKAPPILGVGIGIPGAVDPESGVCLFAAKLGWRGVPVAEIVSRRCGLRTVVDSEVRNRAMAECSRGVAKGVRNMAYLQVAGGLGCALMVDGRMYRGATNRAGEVGHNPVVEGGPVCACGLKGCLQMLTSEQGVLPLLKARVEASKDTQLNPKKLTLQGLFDAATVGDPVALGMVNDIARHLGAGVARLINTIDPEMVVLGGRVFEAGHGLLLDNVRDAAQPLIFDRASRSVRIEASTLGADSGVMGAAAGVYQRLFEVPPAFL
ncbi:MAG: hypothetical protein A3K19_28725 [Lentisphaerae bacterium RIFOXYB12_FULL_65_16]|nr:MAG: hypothetical protein A3K18_01435 [Lentisphaerae bacterium RIFOXYA12_64_32]OGV88264.1 MAG: hypothetical protein A3K19_28725 [Lentisphaerae bacterium RIFOXYB12_FULL_65_16]